MTGAGGRSVEPRKDGWRVETWVAVGEESGDETSIDEVVRGGGRVEANRAEGSGRVADDEDDVRWC